MVAAKETSMKSERQNGGIGMSKSWRRNLLFLAFLYLPREEEKEEIARRRMKRNEEI